jgi:hypothetical protein
MKKREMHNKAWDLLEEKGLKLGERLMVRSAFVTASGYKEQYPFIDSYWDKDGETEYYHSTYDMIKHLVFKKRDEAVLANAIYLNMNEGNSIDEFRQMLKFTFKIIGVNSEWF